MADGWWWWWLKLGDCGQANHDWWEVIRINHRFCVIFRWSQDMYYCLTFWVAWNTPKKKKQRHLSKKSLYMYLYNQINKYRPTFAFTLKTDMKNWLKVRWKNWHLYFSLKICHKIWVNSEFKFRIHLSFERPNLWP